MDDNNKNLNELLIEILKQIHVRLDRLDAKIDTKADKEDVNALKVSLEKDISEVKADISGIKDAVKADISGIKDAVKADISGIKEEVNTLGQRLDRIETGIATLRWVIGAQVAIIGVILAIFKTF